MSAVQPAEKRWCVHYAGFIEPITIRRKVACEAGVVFAGVLERGDGHGLKLPCTGDGGFCPHRQVLTDAEQEEYEAKQNAAIIRYLSDIEANVCPIRHVAVDRRQQVGPCVYARPCGHRLYQGTA